MGNGHRKTMFKKHCHSFYLFIYLSNDITCNLLKVGGNTTTTINIYPHKYIKFIMVILHTCNFVLLWSTRIQSILSYQNIFYVR